MSLRTTLASLSTHPDLPSEAKNLLSDLINWLKSGEVVDRRHSAKVMQLHLSGLPDTSIASELRISESQVRQIRQSVYREASRFISESDLRSLPVLSPDQIDKIHANFKASVQLSSYDLTAQFAPSFLSALASYAQPPASDFDLSQYPEEALFVLSHSIPALDKSLRQLDPQALGYLLALIQNSGGKFKDRAGMISRLTSLAE